MILGIIFGLFKFFMGFIFKEKLKLVFLSKPPLTPPLKEGNKTLHFSKECNKTPHFSKENNKTTHFSKEGNKTPLLSKEGLGVVKFIFLCVCICVNASHTYAQDVQRAYVTKPFFIEKGFITGFGAGFNALQVPEGNYQIWYFQGKFSREITRKRRNNNKNIFGRALLTFEPQINPVFIVFDKKIGRAHV